MLLHGSAATVGLEAFCILKTLAAPRAIAIAATTAQLARPSFDKAFKALAFIRSRIRYVAWDTVFSIVLQYLTITDV